MLLIFTFFFFKQNTAYEMRISYGSSVVCSSDLPPACGLAQRRRAGGDPRRAAGGAGYRDAPLRRQLFHQHRRRTRDALLGKEHRSEEHTSELQSLMRISYAVFCLKKKNTQKKKSRHTHKQKARDQQKKNHDETNGTTNQSQQDKH